VSPPRFISDVIVARKTGQQPLTQWTPEKAIEDMDRGGVATAITSVSEPGVWFGDNEAARRLARECNDYVGRLVADRPTRFGMFATLPMPDVAGSLREIEYAMDTLKADGVCFLTSYQGKYLGDAAFAPVMNELNRRSAVVHTHPARPDCCRNLIPDVPETMIELATDTTRTIASVLFSGTLARCPNIRFIFSHAGGTITAIAGRLLGAEMTAANLAGQPAPNSRLYHLRRFYYDTAGSANPVNMQALKTLVPSSQILFGTDAPFVDGAPQVQGLQNSGFTAEELRGIERDNAVRIVPRLGA
jgi:predicted TIM-barrel fold metal-dependent hydrolase